MTPARYRVTDRRVETADTVTLELHPLDTPIEAPLPGQFTMIYVYGVGEVPISVSGLAGARGIVHTVRAVGAVTDAVCAAGPGDLLGLRGPFGTDWGVPAPAGHDLVIMAGGIGLAPLRPVIRHAIVQRHRYGRVAVLIGARTPGELLYPDEYGSWRDAGLEVLVTVDRADGGWPGRVGVVTTLMDAVRFDPAAATGFVCGPELMMHFGALALTDRGLPPAAVRVSLERNMRCGIALCGHCQLGPLLVCRDGPVVGYDRAAPLMAVKEL
ncbi:MAG: FAD/NAD(P)-binding protein [Micromonosporaceae bacterium]|nr:FAD/NAD(P)-binding protein [Micromonosporaceae bacterium]